MGYYESKIANSGHFMGNVLVQSSGSVGGLRHVFVKLQGGAKNELVFPPIGCIIKNPFKGYAKAFAGDYVEYHIDGTGYLLKTFEMADAATASATDYLLVRDGYHHIPFVGDVIMVAPSTNSTKGAAYDIKAVVPTTTTVGGATVNVWKVTVGTTLGAANKGAVLVEGASIGASVLPLVTKPNMQLGCDYDFIFDPQISDDDFDGARYMLTPTFPKLSIVSKMSPMPAYVIALNKSNVDGWMLI